MLVLLVSGLAEREPESKKPERRALDRRACFLNRSKNRGSSMEYCGGHVAFCEIIASMARAIESSCFCLSEGSFESRTSEPTSALAAFSTGGETFSC